METILEPIVKSPKLQFYINELQRVFDAEQQHRTQFYNTIQEGDKTEFINGEMVFHSPVKLRHNVAGKRLLKLLDTHVEERNLGYVGYEKILISLTRNDYEPDICFFSNEQANKFFPTQMQFPAPDLVVEILSDSTEDKDRGVKFTDYADHGVTEYWIIDPKTEMVEQYLLDGRKYKLQQKSGTGLIKSMAVPGFEIAIRSIFDSQENLKQLQQILANSEPIKEP
jgi:Uma2 family endonuclease